MRLCRAAGWINYLLLPEVINREWNGQGMISWARSHVYAPLKRRCDGVRNTRVAVNIVPLQVDLASVWPVVKFAHVGYTSYVR